MRTASIAALALAAVAAGSAAAADCVDTETDLCLAGGRFRAALEWHDPYNGGGGTGSAAPITDDSGYFWFFRESNIEVVTKVLDGRPVNQSFWVFGAALTTVEHWLEITDTESGLSRRYHNPPFVQARLADTAALDQRLLGGGLLWIAAHPDDELLVAPWLGQACVEDSRSCTLLVATRGENGACRLPGGCPPDLGTARTAEMEAAAALLGAGLVQWTLSDNPGGGPAAVIAAWSAESGGEQELVGRLAAAIASAAPAAVLTFDPRHGSTCHPDHRALGSLVIEALRTLGPSAPPLWLIATRPDGSPHGTFHGYLPAVAGDPRLVHYDATRVLSSAGGEAWEFVTRLAAAHASQYPPAALAALAEAPAARRRVHLVPASAAAPADPAYQGLCGGGG
jgi:LmbE family N-acetylglucosaminyl deacetylase